MTVLGCYQCSRRRIDCDRQEPTCQKCVLKGLSCSGLGVRYRFNDGLASRGRLVGKVLPVFLSYKRTETPSPTLSHARSDDSITFNRHDSVVSLIEQDGDSDDREQLDLHQKCPAGLASNPAMRSENPRTALIEEQRPARIELGPSHIDGTTRYLLQYCVYYLLMIS